MTKQETFDTVLSFLRSQGKAATEVASKACCYRAADGSKCAAGCLIPDELYQRCFEGRAILERGEPTSVGRLLQSLGHDLDLLRELQGTHDAFLVEGVSAWETGMQKVAKRFDLIYAPPSSP